ncbi:MAG: META domain-containing protein [Anaerolineales bacterium]|nr:META domain-containing protein [Anaerolineales bacterium]
MKRFNWLTALVCSAVLVSSCSPIGVTNDPLDETSWELYAYRKTALLEGSTITIRFEDGQVSGNSGCNGYGGRYEVYGDRITVSELFSTMMACLGPEGLMEQEQRYLGYLGTARTYRLKDGQLLVYWNEHEALTFVPAVQE